MHGVYNSVATIPTYRHGTFGLTSDDLLFPGLDHGGGVLAVVDQPQGQRLDAGRRVVQLAQLLDEHGRGE